MKNNIFIIVGIVVVVLIVVFSLKPSDSIAPSEETGDDKTASSNTSGSGSVSPKTSQTSAGSKQTVSKTTATKTSNLPDIEFIDKRISFLLKDFPDVKVTVEKVVFGRGETVTSTGCTGIPNANFSTYLYPGSGICISETEVNGKPRGIVAFHMFIENNGQIGFGGNPDTFKLHYLGYDSSGKTVHKFANQITDFSKNYINQFTSKEIILSFLVPEDQLVYDFVYEYKEPSLENKSLNVYDFSVNGLFVDFGTKTLKIVK